MTEINAGLAPTRGIQQDRQHDTQHDLLAQPLNRRAMLRAAGIGAAGIAAAACSNTGLTEVPLLSPRSDTAPGSVVFDFSSDFGVLNYAYALEQLEAAFYAQVVMNGSFSSIFASNEQTILLDLRDHELVHREFLKAALGANAIGALTPDFSSINFADHDRVLMAARTFEDLGVGAYNGAARYIKNAAYLTVAGKIVSVEARHAAAIRDLLAPRTGEFAPAVTDPAYTPEFVLGQADPFIVDSISVINT